MKSDSFLLEVDITKIKMNPFQPRRYFEKEQLKELAESLKTVGLIHPPVVRPIGEEYELVSGERRFRAALLAGLAKIPVIVREHTDPLSAQAALIENIQRVDLNPIEISKALRSLAKQLQLNQEELAKKIGKKRSTVANYLRLLSLPSAIQEHITSGKISMGHAKVILSIENLMIQSQLAEKIVKEDLTVRQTEEAAQKMLTRYSLLPKTTAPEPDCHLMAVAANIQEKLGTKVTITPRNLGGIIQIEYYSLEDLNRLLTLLIRPLA